jgi:hypothetical protein
MHILVLSAEWQPILHPSAIAPLCNYSFPVCVQLKSNDESGIRSFLFASLQFTPIASVHVANSEQLQLDSAAVAVSQAFSDADSVCSNVSISVRLQHAGHSLSLSVHVR